MAIASDNNSEQTGVEGAGYINLAVYTYSAMHSQTPVIPFD